MFSLRAVVALLTVVVSHVVGNIITPDQLASSYDFVIIGGGLAGLVVASRLSEDQNKTVLVLEAGDTGDAVKSSIDIPGNAYYSSLLGTSYDWQYTTVPQTHLGNRQLPWSRGKVLGGSSAVNGMYLVRPSTIELNANAGLIANQKGATAWGWDSLFAAMKKSETFTPPSPQIQEEGDIQYNLSSHGTSGPLHYSYPGYIVPIVGNWTSTLEWIGILASPDSNGGSGWGASIATSSINPSNWTRSYSRSAYIDPLPPRSNLAILPNATVTRIIFAEDGNNNNNLTATAVEWAKDANSPRSTVNVTKEVILSGGSINSPQVLMLSGIGPEDVLSAAGIPVKVNLPGVGQHLQDHLSAQVVVETTAETAASIKGTSQTSNGTPTPFLSFINSAIAYANSTDLFGLDFPAQFQKELLANLSADAETLVPSSDETVQEGYKAIYTTTVESFMGSQVGQVELLLSLTGTANGGASSIAVQAAIQHPFSQGRVYITSSDPFTYPLIDPQYFSHPADLLILREGLKLARKITQTQPLNASVSKEISPGSSVVTDGDWDAWIPGVVGTEYHPSCTCAMLPLEQGGVVNANLTVYGTANLRVVDASIYPMEFAAHLQAITYAVGEQAAEIIRALYNGVPPPSASVTSTPTGVSIPSATNTQKSSAVMLSPTRQKLARMLRNATLSPLPYLIPRNYGNHFKRQIHKTPFTSAQPEPNKPIQLDPDLQDLLRDVDLSLTRSKASLKRKSWNIKRDGSITHQELEIVSRTPSMKRQVDNEEEAEEDADPMFPKYERKSPAAAYGSRRIGSVVLPFEMQKSILKLISESDKPLIHVDANRLFNPLEKEDRSEEYGRNPSSWSLHYTPSESTEAHSASRMSHIKARLTRIRDGTAFASVVMPAQYAVIRAVLEQIKSRLGSQWSQNIDRVIEWGSGTGAGIWASHHTFQTSHESLPTDTPPSDETSETMESTQEEEQYTEWLENDRNTPRNLRLEWSTLTSYIAIENRDGLSNIARKLLKDIPTTTTMSIQKELNDEQLLMSNIESGKGTIAISAFLLNTIQVPGLRKAMLREMWNSGADVMVIIEDATTKGFQNVTDARDFLLRRGNKQLEEEVVKTDHVPEMSSKQGAHVLAPCPHDKPCPLAFHQKISPSKRGSADLPSFQRMERCTFTQRLQRPSFVRLTKHAKRGEEDVGYSYVVIRRGERVRPPFGIGQLQGRKGAIARWGEEAKKAKEEERNEQIRNSWVMDEDEIEPVSAIPVDDGLAMSEDVVEGNLDPLLDEVVVDGLSEDELTPVSFMSESDHPPAQGEELEAILREESYSWPRINFSPMKRGGHIIIDACTTEGTIMRMTYPRSQGKQIYYDARKSGWGDIFPHAPKSRPVPRFSGRPGKITKALLKDADAAEREEREASKLFLPSSGDERIKKTKRILKQQSVEIAPDSIKASRAGWSGVFGQLKEEERRKRHERRKVRYEKEVEDN